MSNDIDAENRRLDALIVERDTAEQGQSRTQADRLIALAARATLFHAPENTAFADVPVNGHRETWPVRSSTFRQWLGRAYFESSGGAANKEALQRALALIEARAQFDGVEANVYLRVADLEEVVYLDLGDSQWRAIEIKPTGWRVVEAPPVRFRRTPGMLALPEPRVGGCIDNLRSFINIRNDADFVLLVAWLAAAMRGRAPFPILNFSGEQGSAKSTASDLSRSLIDPNSSPLRSLPRNDHDLFISAHNGYLVAFDNVSSMPSWLSDTLCRLACGGGFSTRTLYSDTDETLLTAARPIIINGIENVAQRPDFAERSLFSELEPISEEARRPEAELRADFAEARPFIFGALLDIVAHGLRKWPDTCLKRLPRMADFAKWGSACETAFVPRGRFMAAYDSNRAEALHYSIDADPVASAVRNLMEERDEWTGTATELFDALTSAVGEKISRRKDWPQAANAISGRLNRVAPALRRIGIQVVRRKSGDRRVTITRQSEVGKRSSGPSKPPKPAENRPSGRTIPRTMDGPTDDPMPETAQANPLEKQGKDGPDDPDDLLHTQGGGLPDLPSFLVRRRHRQGQLSRALAMPSTSLAGTGCP